jgi:hypothetical protein
LRPAPKTLLGLFVRRTLTAVVGCAGLAWGIFVLPWSETTDDLRDVEARLLRFETFNRTTLTRTLEDPVSQRLGACDTHPQRAMLLIEMPLAEAALRSGSVDEFDQHIQSLETRSRQILSCAPRESLVWLLVFNLEVLHGRLNEHSFNQLDMSYDTSPNEAWISIRRIVVAMPLVLVAPEPVQKKILFEFQQLIRNGFVDDAARAYLTAAGPIRSLLQTRVDQLDLPRQQKAFSAALQKLRS